METIFYNSNHAFDCENRTIIAILAGVECGQRTTGSLDTQIIVSEMGNNSQLVALNFETLKDDIARVKPDGLILPGGMFDEKAERYTAYLDAIEYAKQNALPTLAFCAGMQLLAVSYGAKQKIIDDEKTHKNLHNHFQHKVEIAPNSLLANMLGENEITVNSRHKLYVADVPQGIDAIAFASDGDNRIIEAIKADYSNFVLGVQWHPENLAVQTENLEVQAQARKIFKDFFCALRRKNP